MSNEQITCASCDMEHAKSESRNVVVGDLYDKDTPRHRSTIDYTFYGGTTEAWLCPHCVEEPLWGKLPTKPSLPIPSVGSVLYNAVYAAFKYVIIFLTWPTKVAEDVVKYETSLMDTDATLIGILVFIAWVIALIIAGAIALSAIA